SEDGGLTWSEDKTDDFLVEPVCQGSVLPYAPHGKESDQTYLLFSNPASTKRENMTVRLSADDGVTWVKTYELYEGPSAYSDLVILPQGGIGCLYERGEKGPYESIVLTFIHPATC